MDPLVARIWRTVRRFSLIPPGARLLVAVSGGADSVALLYALGELQRAGEAELAGVLHLNHGLRGADADEDEAFCRHVAAEMCLPFECERSDVRALAADRGLSLEAAGHLARYEFFDRAASRLGAGRVALGHTRDDQAETFLLRLLRGAGPKGLGGMYPAAGRVIRPMLDCSRSQVRRFLAARGLPFREDPSNEDVSIPRNLVRHDLMPRLAQASPGIVRVLGREAAIARDDEEFLDACARSVAERVTRVQEESVELDAVALRGQPRAVARRVAMEALSLLAGQRFIGFEHVERLLDLADNENGRAVGVDLPGQHAERVADRLILRRKERVRGNNIWGTNSFHFSLSIPGEVVSPSGWAVSAERHAIGSVLWGSPPDGAEEPVTENRLASVLRSFPRSWAALDATAVGAGLVVRGWRPGDRFRPLGMRGTRKVQDFFVDRKTPRADRGEIPIVVDAADRVLWIAGHAIAEDFRVTPATSDVVILKLKYWRNGT